VTKRARAPGVMKRVRAKLGTCVRPGGRHVRVVDPETAHVTVVGRDAATRRVIRSAA
jgi:hypothetical protein